MTDDQHYCVGVGDEVPPFQLETFDPANGGFGTVSLESLKQEGKWTVLFFYPADFTFVWATEHAALAERYEQLRELGAEVITVSTATKFVHLAWQREEKLLRDARYPMGADPTGNISQLFGVYDEQTGLPLRGTFIISPEGKLVSAEIHFYNVGRNIDELLRKVKANRYLADHPHEVCPAQWKEAGDRTLTPSAQLVGRVAEAMR